VFYAHVFVLLFAVIIMLWW